MSTHELLKLIALVVPLGLDTLGVSIALGVGGLAAHRRVRVALVFAAFEAAMPLVGLLLGTPLGDALGGAGQYVGAGIVLLLGAYLLLAGEREETQRLGSLARGGAMGAIALGLSISLDELAIGFSAGILRLPVVPLAAAVAVQAFLMTQLGLRIGASAATIDSDVAERVAGIALIALGVLLVSGLG